MEINGVHKPFLHDWLVSFLYWTGLPYIRHDSSIHDKFTKEYIVTCIIDEPKQKLVASSQIAELKFLKKAIWITLSHPFSTPSLWQVLYVPVKLHFPIYCQRLPFHITHQSVRNIKVMKIDTVAKRRWAMAIVVKAEVKVLLSRAVHHPGFPAAMLAQELDSTTGIHLLSSSHGTQLEIQTEFNGEIV